MTENKCTFFYFFFKIKGISSRNVPRGRKLLLIRHLACGFARLFYKLLVAKHINNNCCQVAAFFNILN